VQEITIYGTSGQWQVSGEGIRNFFTPAGGPLMSRNFYIAGAGGGGASAPVSVTVTDGHSVISGDLASFILGNITPGQVTYVFDGHTMRRLVPEAPQPALGSNVTINGRGWGHGVGMSQRGAAGMALLGYDYRQILMHYYTGVEIR